MRKLIYKSGSFFQHLVQLLFGAPFAGGGAAVLYLGFSGQMGDAPVFFFLPFGSVFLFVGLSIMFYRKRIYLDGQDVLTKTYIIIPIWTSTQNLGSIKKVGVYREIRVSRNKNGGETRRIVYAIRLGGAGGDEVTAPGKEFAARNIAEGVAKGLQIPLEDGTLGETYVRQPEELDMSLKQLVQHRGETIEKPEEPKGCFVISDEKARRLFIPSTISWGRIGMTCAIAAVGFSLIYFFMVKDIEDKQIACGVMAVLAVIGGIAFMLVLVGSLVSHDIQFSHNEVLIRSKWAIFGWTKRLLLNELEEIRCVEGKSFNHFNNDSRIVVLRSDAEEIRIARCRNHKDMEFAAEMMRYYAAGG